MLSIDKDNTFMGDIIYDLLKWNKRQTGLGCDTPRLHQIQIVPNQGAKQVRLVSHSEMESCRLTALQVKRLNANDNFAYEGYALAAQLFGVLGGLPSNRMSTIVKRQYFSCGNHQQLKKYQQVQKSTATHVLKYNQYKLVGCNAPP